MLVLRPGHASADDPAVGRARGYRSPLRKTGKDHGLPGAAQGEVIPTGPSFVTKATAAQAIRLSKRSIR